MSAQKGIGPAHEIDIAMPIGRTKTKAIRPAHEIDIAMPIGVVTAAAVVVEEIPQLPDAVRSAIEHAAGGVVDILLHPAAHAFLHDTSMTLAAILFLHMVIWAACRSVGKLAGDEPPPI